MYIKKIFLCFLALEKYKISSAMIFLRVFVSVMLSTSYHFKKLIYKKFPVWEIFMD